MDLFIVLNTEWSFLSHRLPIALEALDRNYKVTVLAFEEESKGDVIRSYGLRFIPLPSERGKMNIFKDLLLLRFLYNIYRKEKPDIVHHVAIKAVVYGSIAAWLSGIDRIVNAVAGLGSTFIDSNKSSLINQLIRHLYGFSLRRKNVEIIAQNGDDINFLIDQYSLDKSNIHLIRGSGVYMDVFKYSLQPDTSIINIILLSRMIWDKGIGEYVKAAKILKSKFGDKLRFILAGKIDHQNQSGISLMQLSEWNKEGDVEWVGHVDDIVSMHRDSHISVLPSYREGLPRFLIEALASGRPVVTTDVPGCKEVVDHGINGYLVKVKDEVDLASAIERLIVNPQLRAVMGKKGREKAEKEFSIEMVVDKTFSIYESTK